MQSSLLSLRLQLQHCSTAPLPEPMLRVGSTCVAALWSCGCASVGTDFDAMTLVPCRLHHDRLLARSAFNRGLPSAAQVKRELQANSFPRE